MFPESCGNSTGLINQNKTFLERYKIIQMLTLGKCSVLARFESQLYEKYCMESSVNKKMRFLFNVQLNVLLILKDRVSWLYETDSVTVRQRRKSFKQK